MDEPVVEGAHGDPLGDFQRAGAEPQMAGDLAAQPMPRQRRATPRLGRQVDDRGAGNRLVFVHA